MSTPHNIFPIRESDCVRRGTNRRKGRTTWLAPSSAAVRHLRYGRIILGSGDAPIRFPTEGLETGLICLNGGGTVKTGQEAAGSLKSR